jgi:hypothetical protein
MGIVAGGSVNFPAAVIAVADRDACITCVAAVLVADNAALADNAAGGSAIGSVNAIVRGRNNIPGIVTVFDGDYARAKETT